MMNRFVLSILAFATIMVPTLALADDGPMTRIKDITEIEGVRTNALIGYGLVVGLNGTGDSANNIPFTSQTLGNILESMGLNAKATESQIKSKNVAAVMVTAELPPFAREGSTIDVSVSSMGDAKSLEGGQLLVTPLIGADGATYALAQGALIIGGFTAQGQSGSTVTQNHPTSGRIADGATVEKETGFELSSLKRLRFILKNPDFTTAMRISDAINKSFKENVSKAEDNHTVDVALPARYANYKVAAIEKIENLTLRPDTAARVVIDEKTGTVVMGDDVRLSTVAISHANLTIRVNELPQVSQPNALSGGQTAAVARTDITVDEGKGKFAVLHKQATLADLVAGLNALGVQPRDIISILQAIKAAGAMQADIELM